MISIGWALVGGLIKRVAGFAFDDGRGKVAILAAVAAAFVGWFAWDQRSIGAATAVAEGRQINAKGHSVGAAGARNSNRPGAGSVRDPSTVIE